MRANDAFRAELHDTIRDIGAWADGLTDVSGVEIAETAEHWRLRLNPRAPSACPVEIILYSDQTYDVIIGQETYEGRPLDTFPQIPRLLAAIAEGRVITREWTTVATGARHSIATVVEMSDGEVWYGERNDDIIGRVAGREACAVRDRHYSPYRSVFAHQAA